MGLSTNTYTYTGGPKTFAVNFADGFLERDHVTVYRVGDVDGMGNQVYLTFTWNSDAEVLVSDALSNGDEITVERTVEKQNLLVDLDNPGALTREALERNARQTLHAVHEALDGRWDYNLREVVTTARDETVAAKDAAETARDQAQGFADDADLDADRATNRASDALTYRDQARTARDTASGHATTAGEARDQAQTAAGTASGAATAAQTSANDANTAASAAATSETNAGTSEANALTYRNQAQDAADSINAAVMPFANRPAVVTWVASNTAPDGTVISDGVVQYVAKAGATAIADMLGWLPFGDVTDAHLGISGVGDEYDKFQAVMDLGAGGVVRLSGHTIEVGTSTLTISPGTTVLWGGTVVKRSTSANSYVVAVAGDGVTFLDDLSVETAGERGVSVNGSYFTWETIRVVADNPGTGSGSLLKDAFRVGDPVPVSPYKQLNGRIYVENFEIGFAAKGLADSRVRIDAVNYRTAVWIIDGQNIEITGSAKTGSALNLASPGENGVLLEASAHGAAHGITILGFHTEDSGEHGFRVGGQNVIKGVRFIGCKAIRPGSGLPNAPSGDGHGGSGFKCLGPTTVDGAYHQDIHFVDCVAEDVPFSDPDDDNFAGFNIGKTYNYSLVNPIVRRSQDSFTGDPYTPPTYSCKNGIEIIGSTFGQITNPMIDRPELNGIHFYDSADTGGVTWGSQNGFCTVVGGRVDVPGQDGVRCTTSDHPFRRISIQGLEIEGATNGLNCILSGTGSFILCTAEYRLINGTAATGASNWLLTVKGNFFGANDCLNGSTFQDTSAGTLKVRKAGAWVNL